MQLLGREYPWPLYQRSASSWVSNRRSTFKMATNLQWRSRYGGYFSLCVMYMTQSPGFRRGANFCLWQSAEIEGHGDSKSGSRRQDASTKAGMPYCAMAERPARFRQRGL